MPSNVKIGNDIIQNVSEVKLQSADNPGEYVVFSDGSGQKQYKFYATIVGGGILNGHISAQEGEE